MLATAAGELAEIVSRSVGLTAQWMLDRQHRDGYWVGELEGDTILESEYVLLKAFLGELDQAIVVKCCRYLRQKQRSEGGWAIYPGGPFDLSASVKAYWALKLVGVPIDEPDMVRARDLILEAGGANRCNSFTRFYLALLGQIPYSECPYVPPELVLLPSWLPFSLAEMSAWTRTMVVPLSLISLKQPVRHLPKALGIQELYLPDQPSAIRWTKPSISWSNLFVTTDRMMKWWHQVLPSFLRRPGERAALRWMEAHFENSDGLGAIYPPMVYTIFVLRALGKSRGDATYDWAVKQLEDLIIEEDSSARIQPCVSPVWDTAIGTIAMADAGGTGVPVARAADWLISKEIREAGDWAVRRRFRKIKPSGWAFEFLNEHYADLDDTAMVIMALARSGTASKTACAETIERATNWLLSLQGTDGGWAAFDADIDNEVLTKVPFADHNAMLDPSCPDITARVLEMMGVLGMDRNHPSAQRALQYLWKTQEPEGCWFGRWGVNYIYGTWQVLQGLAALGFPMADPRVQRAANWLESVQGETGGWGESCASYEDRHLMGKGIPTASQTAWAVLGLIAAGRAQTAAVRKGIQWLVRTQQPDGSWEETEFTGTGFPKVFYLRYHLYRVAFPLMALARWSKTQHSH